MMDEDRIINEREKVFDRRVKNNIKDWAVIITLFINLGGLIWTAARWSSAIEQLQVTAIEINKTLINYGTNIQMLTTKEALLEYQAETNRKNIYDLQRRP